MPQRRRMRGQALDGALVAALVKARKLTPAEADQWRQDVAKLSFLERKIAELRSEASVVEARVVATAQRVSAAPTFGAQR